MNYVEMLRDVTLAQMVINVGSCYVTIKDDVFVFVPIVDGRPVYEKKKVLEGDDLINFCNVNAETIKREYIKLTNYAEEKSKTM